MGPARKTITFIALRIARVLSYNRVPAAPYAARGPYGPYTTGPYVAGIGSPYASPYTVGPYARGAWQRS